MKKPLLRSLFISYIAVLIPIAILCIALFGNFRAVQESNMAQLQQSKAQQYQQSLESELNEIDLILNQVFSDNLKNRFSSKENLTYSDKELLMNLRTQFAASVRSLGSLDEILLYYEKSGYAVTSRVVVPLESAYPLTGNETATALWGSYDSLCTRLEQLSGKKLYMDEDRLYFSCRVDKASGVLFSMNKEYLLSLYPAADPGVESFALADAHGNLILHSGEAFPLNLSGLQSGQMPASDSEWFVTTQKLDNQDYYVVTALSRAHMDSVLLQRIGWLFLALPLCILLSVWLVYRAVTKHYNPIAQLLQLASEHGLAPNKNVHEYEQLNQLLRKELDDQQSLKQKQTQERQHEEDAKLLRALSTPQAGDAISAAFARQELPFPKTHWCFAEINLLDYSEKDEETMLSIARLLISNNIAQNFPSISLLARQRLIFIIGMSDDIKKKSVLLKSDLQRDMNFLKEEYEAEFSCNITEILPWQADFGQVTATLMGQLSKMRKAPLPNMSAIHVFQPLDDETQQALSRISKMEQDILRGHYDDLTGDLKQLAGFSVIQAAAPEAKKASGTSQIIQQVVDLVQSNYYDQNLNISYLAQQVGRHPSVLSKAFREQIGIGLLDYIHTVRIEEAKKLLVEHPDMTVQRISELCGYVNSDSFQRTFKRITETTPGKYRDSHI